jgi:hypothetical protein
VEQLGVALHYFLIGTHILPVLHEIIIAFPLQLLPHLAMRLLLQLLDLTPLDSRLQLRHLIHQLHPLLESLVPLDEVLDDELQQGVHGEAVDARLLEVDVLEDREDDVLDDTQSEDLEVYLEDLALRLRLTLLVRQLAVERSAVVVCELTVVVVAQEVQQVFRSVPLLDVIGEAIVQYPHPIPRRLEFIGLE